MASAKEGDPVERALDLCAMTQCMIDITQKNLHGLRTQCRITEEITQKEICETESKLVKLFSKQLVAKAKLKLDEVPEKLHEYPNTKQWLTIVGINPRTTQSIVQRDIMLESLLEMTEEDVERLLARYETCCSDIHKLNAALRNLKLWTEQQLAGDKGTVSEMELHWSSYKSASNSPYGGSSPKLYQQRPSTSSLPPDAFFNTQLPHSPASPPTPPQSTPTSPVPCISPAEKRKRFTPPPTPPLVKTSKGKFPTTPPPNRKNKLHPDVFHPLTKSKSHESQLSKKVNQDVDMSKYLKKKPVNLTITGSYEAISGMRKRSTDGDLGGFPSRGLSGQISPLPLCSPKKSPTSKHIDCVNLEEVHPMKKNQLVVPISPSPRINMKHAINHRFANTFKITTCDLCQKQMFLGYKCKECKFQTKMVLSVCDMCNKYVIRGKVCRECKAKYHRECAAKAAPACGLPQELLALYLESISTGDGSPGMMRRVSATMSLPADPRMVHATSVPAFQAPDSSSTTSSCNSSTPSSPAFFTTPPSPAQPSPQVHVTPATDQQFHFPDVSVYHDGYNSISTTLTDSIGTVSSLMFESDIINTNTSNDSDKSDKTLVDTGSGSEKMGLLGRGNSTESGEDGLGQSWHRVNSISVTLKEWEIDFDNVQILDKLGTGRFGTVSLGNWHGPVAIKMLSMDPEMDNYAQLQSFKREIAMLRKTRHENLVLFMGACMKPPDLAIITSLCKGGTLFTLLHIRKEKFPLNKVIIISSQIAQGMGYLHCKDIVHKDLKTKNIFLENGKVIISDYGLFSVTKLCLGRRKGDCLSIPPGWLCYLAPEIMRALTVGRQRDMNLPFSEFSDIYAFGTVWYELLCGEWPFKDQHQEAIIWQVGKGMKQSLGNLHASREVKDFLMGCWGFLPDDRPDFASVLKTMSRMPKTLKRLARSPSHPIQLSRSAESVF